LQAGALPAQKISEDKIFFLKIPESKIKISKILSALAGVLTFLATVLIVWCIVQHYYIVFDVCNTGALSPEQAKILAPCKAFLIFAIPALVIGTLLGFAVRFLGFFNLEIPVFYKIAQLYSTLALIVVILFSCFFTPKGHLGSDTIAGARGYYYKRNYLEPMIAERLKPGAYCSEKRLLARKRIAYLNVGYAEFKAGVLRVGSIHIGNLGFFFTKEEFEPEFDPFGYQKRLPQEPLSGVILEWTTTYDSGRRVTFEDSSPETVPEYVTRVHFMAVDLETHCMVGNTYRDGPVGETKHPGKRLGGGVRYIASLTNPPPSYKIREEAVQSLLEPAGEVGSIGNW
jgi:hypothetical protein